MRSDHTVRLSGDVADPAVWSGESLLPSHGCYGKASRLAAAAVEWAASAVCWALSVVGPSWPVVGLETHGAKMLC